MAKGKEELGISIRVIRQFDIEADRNPIRSVYLHSCALLGHTWRINVGEPFCNVCGAPNLTGSALPEPEADA